MPVFDRVPAVEGAFVAPSASVIGDVVLSPGASVWYGAIVRADVNSVRIGARASIGDRAVVHVTRHSFNETPRGVVVGDDVQVGAGAALHSCTLEPRAVVGDGATVLDGAVVGHDAMVAPGSVVAGGTRIGPKELWAGAPATKQRDLTNEEVATLTVRSKAQEQLAQVHRHETTKGWNQLRTDAIARRRAQQRDPDFDEHIGLSQKLARAHDAEKTNPLL